MDVLIAVGILALFVLFAAYVWTDLGDHMAEQERLDELWCDEVGVGGSVRSSSSVSRGWPTDADSFPRVTVYARTGPKDAA